MLQASKFYCPHFYTEFLAKSYLHYGNVTSNMNNCFQTPRKRWKKKGNTAIFISKVCSIVRMFYSFWFLEKKQLKTKLWKTFSIILGTNNHKLILAWFLFSANWTGVTATFVFERIYSYFIYNVYGPSVIVVIISWVGFVIPRDTPAARVTLAVTAVLTIVTILTILNSSIAKVRHANFYTTYCWLFQCRRAKTYQC